MGWLAAVAATLLVLDQAVIPSRRRMQDVSGSAAEDKAALLAFKSDGNTANAALSGWTADSEPCDDASWDSRNAGWFGVMCDGPSSDSGFGRVTVVYVPNQGLVGDIAAFAPMANLRLLRLSNNVGVHGDLASLVKLVQVRHLKVHGSAVVGEVPKELIWVWRAGLR